MLRKLVNPRSVALLGLALSVTGGAPLAAGPAAPEGAEAAVPPVECVELLRAARIAHLEDDSDAELDSLHAAAERFPDEVAPTYSLLVYARDHGLPDEERQRLEDRLEERLADVERPLPPALLQQVALDPETDEALIRRIEVSVARRLEAHPEAVTDTLLALHAGLQQRVGDDAAAADTLERLWRRTGDPGTAWTLIRLDLGLEHWSEALEVLESDDELEEELWQTHLHLLAKTGSLDRALALLDRRIDDAVGAGLDGGGFDDSGHHAGTRLLEDLAWSFRDAGRDAEAEALFRRALARQPSDPELEAVLLHLYSSDAERREHAEQVARNWQEQTDPQALLDEGTQRLATGDAEGALDLLERAAPAFPNLEAPWFNLGMAAYRLERWPRVVEALGTATELNPERAAAFFFRGVALVQLERCAEAVEDLERAVALDPERTQAHYYLAGCYRELGRPEDAAREQALYEAAGSS
jgi:tetratricopeptide (TPR) repeat protein